MIDTDRDEMEQKVVELATLYPHPEAYRKAMHFYENWTDDKGAVRRFARKVLALLPEDEDAIRTLTMSYLTDDDIADEEVELATSAVSSLARIEDLSPEHRLRFAGLLQRAGDYREAYSLAESVWENPSPDEEQQMAARAIGVRSSLATDDWAPGQTALDDVPTEQMTGELLTAAARLYARMSEPDRAADLLATHLRTERLSPTSLLTAARFVEETGTHEEFVDALFANAGDTADRKRIKQALQRMCSSPLMSDSGAKILRRATDHAEAPLPVGEEEDPFADE